ncbi:uncharacterized protein PAC_17352 [Phialocephala subalpina]|uniref:Uncharacterized protein n=1 Tax=Phialocephala subalpina TaxID=576137 RepID=A0A1L7XQY0_9HELO|nr:uncharacterized protein PAC_17352 [Phialocephala subalpina]
MGRDSVVSAAPPSAKFMLPTPGHTAKGSQLMGRDSMVSAAPPSAKSMLPTPEGTPNGAFPDDFVQYLFRETGVLGVDLIAPKPKHIHGLDDIREVMLLHLTSSNFTGLDGACKAQFDVLWEVDDFLREQFPDVAGIDVSSVIVLTGDLLQTQATTGYEGDREINFQESSKLQKVLVHASKDEIIEIAQQLAWLGCALRTSKPGNICKSTCQISWRGGLSGGQTSMEFSTEPPSEENSCWHALFTNPVIASGFSIDKRNDEKGLEIPIEMMTVLGGASHAVEFDGGIVIKGFSSMFVPIQRTGNSIQWHYIHNDENVRLPYWEVDSRCPSRALMDVVDLDSITTTRAFLGWWGKTTCELGTINASYENIDWSDTKEPSLYDPRSKCLGFRGLGGSKTYRMHSGTTGMFSPGPKDGQLHISHYRPYQRIVRYASRTPVVLYDTSGKRAWLVPSSAVIAHIAQTRHRREPFSVNGKVVELTPADPTFGISEGAEQMLLDNSSVKLNDDEPGTGDYRFRDLVLSVWSLLENLLDRNAVESSRAQKNVTRSCSVDGTPTPSLRGWEFMDIVQERSPIRQKETSIQETNGGWMDFVEDLKPVVLFASGFEDLIKPDLVLTPGLCSKWRHMPKDKDYLAASVSILNILYEEAGSRLTRKYLTSTHLQWSRGQTLFEVCTDSVNHECKCDRLQQIDRESNINPETFRPPEYLENYGAVIFGQESSQTIFVAHSGYPPNKDFRYYNAKAIVDHKEPLLPLLDSSSDTSEAESNAGIKKRIWPSRPKYEERANSKRPYTHNEGISFSNGRHPKKRSQGYQGYQGLVLEEPRQPQQQFRYEPVMKDANYYVQSISEHSTHMQTSNNPERFDRDIGTPISIYSTPATRPVASVLPHEHNLQRTSSPYLVGQDCTLVIGTSTAMLDPKNGLPLRAQPCRNQDIAMQKSTS